MDLVKLGTLRAYKIVKTSGNTSKTDGAATPLTVVLMHGYGAPGDDLISLAGAIDAPVGTTFIFPEAPNVLMADARAWWQIDIGRFQRAMMHASPAAIDELTKDIPDGMKAAREHVVSLLDALGDARIAIGGFSQGSMLAIDVALRTKRELAGVVVMSGTLLAASEWVPLMAARKDLAVFQSHGTEDPILPYVIAEKLRQVLGDNGLRVSFTSFDGGHGIPPSVLRDLGTWLRALK